MKKLLLGLLLLPSLAYGEVYTEKYAVETDEGVAIVHYITGSAKSLEDVLRDTGLAGKSVKRIGKSDIPPTRNDRKYWKYNPIGSQVLIDQAKKQADLDAESAKETKRQAVRTKIGITKKDWEDLNAK